MSHERSIALLAAIFAMLWVATLMFTNTEDAKRASAKATADRGARDETLETLKKYNAQVDAILESLQRIEKVIAGREGR